MRRRVASLSCQSCEQKPSITMPIPRCRYRVAPPSIGSEECVMSTYLYRLGRFAVRRRWFVLGAWVLAVVAISIGGKAVGGQLKDQFTVPGVESQQATDLLK